MSRRSRTWFSIILGLTVSTFFLWLALRQVDFAALVEAVKSANYGFVLISCAALAAGLALRSLRWHMIAGAPPEAHLHFYHATTAGALSNMILPARAGEVVRIFALARLTGSRLANPVVSALLDRLMDVVAILLGAFALLFLLPNTGMLDQWLGTIVIVGGIITTAVFAAAAMMGVAQSLVARLAERWLKNWKMRPDAFFGELHAETRRVFESWMSFRLLVLLILILLVDWVAVGSQIFAFHLDLPPQAALLLWVFLVIGSLLPSAPGYIGVYQTAAVWALSFFSVPPSSAVALAVVLQAATYVVTFAMVGPGFWSLIKSALDAERAREA